MADQVLLLNNRLLSKVGGLVFDATINEMHTSSVEITDHAVEQGANITDHARVKPEMLSLECIVSDTPAIGEAKPGAAANAYAELLAMKDARELLSVQTTTRLYEDMLIETLSVPVNASTGDALRFSITFKQVRVVLVQFSSATVKRTATTKGKKKASTGAQPSETASDTPQKTKTTLKAVSDFGNFTDRFLP